MADVLKDGLAWLTGKLREYAAQTVTYSRGTDSVDVPATFGKKLLKIDDGMGGIRVEWTDMDFLIPAADLVLNGSPVIPQRGDLIHITEAYDTQTFEVLPFGSEPAWRWSDPHQSMLRIHTKRVNLEAFYG